MKNLFAFALFITSLTMIAQIGPGGVGNSSNNVIWLDGNLVTVGTSPNIATWTDQSGNGNGFSQATSTNQPRIVTYFGFNGVRFDGGDWLRRGGTTALNSNTSTQYIIYNGSTANHVGILYEGSFTQSSQFFRTFRQNGNARSWVLNNVGGIIDNTTTNSSGFQILSNLWDGNAATYQSFKDGASIGVKNGANGNPTGNFLNTIGAASNNAFRFNGDMGEVIMYNTVLNSAQRNIVDNYLSSKFNIAIANDLYAYDAGLTHRFQVFGIGQEADGNNLTAQGKGIVQLSSVSLNNGEYILSGHNNTALSQVTNDVPSSITGGSRLTRTWRVGVTGTPSPITVSFDVSSLPLSAGNYHLLVESANGIFNDGGVVSYGPFADVGGIVTFNGVSFADGDYYTIATGNATSIQSVKTGFWDIASTWNCNCVPTATEDVLITAGHTVTVRTTVTTNNLTIDGNLNTQAAGNFTIKGDLTLNGSGTFVNKTVIFSGTVAQNLTNNSSNTVVFSTLIINNSNGVNIQTGNFSLANSIQIPNGLLTNVGGNFTFLSTSTTTAVALNINGGFAGNFLVQRYVSSRNANWADLSSPVSNATLGEWDSDLSGTVTELFMSGVNGIDGDAAGFQSVYYYDENTQAYVTVTDTNYNLVAGRGVELWLGDDLNTWNAKTFDTRGTPNFGNVAILVANSWNLVGNPYQAWVNWENLSKPTLNSTYYIWNTNNGSYDAKTSGSIPPHQGFWVESVGSGTLTFNESSKSGSGSSTFFRTSGDEIVFPAIDDEAMMNQGAEPFEFSEVKLKVSSTINTFSHELKLRMNNLASINHDYHDGSFLPSRVLEAPSITSYSANNNKKLAINSFNYQDEILLPVAIKVGISGKYNIEAINFENLATDYAIMELTDTKTRKVYDLTAQKQIEVLIDEFEDNERFSLKLSNSRVGDVSSTSSNGVTIYKSNETTVLQFEDAAVTYQLSAYNALGQKVMEDKTISNTNSYTLNNEVLAKGLVIIKVTSSNGETIKKLTY